MKNHFPAYYRIHRDKIFADFEQCLIVFDANALLDIFRLSKDTTKRIFDVIEHYKSQIRIPYHAAWEYNKDIVTVLGDQIAKVDEASRSLDKFMQIISARRNQPYISDKSNRHLNNFKNSIEQDFKEQREYLLNQMQYGELQNRMAKLLDGCVLDSFTKEEIAAIEKEGEERYKNQVPPGWKDADKGNNRYGDLINWKEILQLAKQQQKSVLLVSNDQKEDWIIEKQGKKIYPQYDLLTEFYYEVGNPNLWFQIYTLDRFLDFINEKDDSVVSVETIKEVRDSLENIPMDHVNFLYDYVMATPMSVESPLYLKTLESLRLYQGMKEMPYYVPELLSKMSPPGVNTSDVAELLKANDVTNMYEDSLGVLKMPMNDSKFDERQEDKSRGMEAKGFKKTDEHDED